MLRRILIIVVVLLVILLAVLRILGAGILGGVWTGGDPTRATVPQAELSARSVAQKNAARAAGAFEPKQILFGDLHVHSTFSTDAFLMSMPLAGGDGARPVSDACDYARFCSSLDFWSINDHAVALSARRWQETVDSIRACNEVSGDPENPDVAAFLGWEWTQIGTTPQDHYGHKNVILRHTDDARIPTRPINAGIPRGGSLDAGPGPLALGLLPLTTGSQGIDMVKYFNEMIERDACEEGVPVRELPDACFESARTPDLLFSKLNDWGHESIVIPHGTTWGYYTPHGSAWDKQLTPEMHDPERQRLIEVFSGHGNSEEFRPWEEVHFAANGEASCPEPRDDYLPACWRAGEIIEERCLETGASESECADRAEETRRRYVEEDVLGHHVVAGESPAEWGDSGQCRDCFLPSFNYRPKSSAQYILALSRTGPDGEPMRFRFGMMASSDNHSSRPGTGYKEYDRRDATEMRFAGFGQSVLGQQVGPDEPLPYPIEEVEVSPTALFGAMATERQASFFLTGGLVAVHAEGRSRSAIWESMQRKEVYGTSGPRILLWFDLLNPPGTRGTELPMGSEAAMDRDPVFRVRAVGSFEQLPGCPSYAGEAMGEEGLERLCKGECYHPSDQRRLVTRIEVVRIRPQESDDEAIEALVEDPWKVIPCDADPDGCRVTFSDPEFSTTARDAVYYVRAIEEPGLAVNADPIGCASVPLDDDCLGEVEERAWSSPIFVDYSGSTSAIAGGASATSSSSSALASAGRSQ